MNLVWCQSIQFEPDVQGLPKGMPNCLQERGMPLGLQADEGTGRYNSVLDLTLPAIKAMNSIKSFMHAPINAFREFTWNSRHKIPNGTPFCLEIKNK